jgi:hypothetical protein
VSALLPALNALAARLAILAVPIAPIPRETQPLLFFRILNSAHAAAPPSSAEYGTVASRLKRKVAQYPTGLALLTSLPLCYFD